MAAMTVDLLYFARIREAVGRSGETLSLPVEIVTIADLTAWLAGRGDGYADAFADPSKIRAAIGDQFAGPQMPIAGAREISLFPPVTGG